MEVRVFVQECFDVGDDGRVIDQFREHRIVFEDVEDACVRAVDLRSTVMGFAPLVQRTPHLNDRFQTFGQARGEIGRKRVLDDEVIVPFGLGWMVAHLDREGKGLSSRQGLWPGPIFLTAY